MVLPDESEEDHQMSMYLSNAGVGPIGVEPGEFIEASRAVSGAEEPDGASP